VFFTAWLIYLAFLNPWLQSSMTWNYLDAAVSFVQTGRWDLRYADLYYGMDTAHVGSRAVSGMPPGASFAALPVYALWHWIGAPIASPSGFQALNAILALLVGTFASALTAVHVRWLAAHLGASPVNSAWAAILFALGTQAFFFGTTFYKENLAGLAVATALRLAVGGASTGRAILAGVMAGAAGLTSYPTLLLMPLVVGLVVYRDGVRRAALVTLGCSVGLLVLVGYNVQQFGSPLHFSTFSIPGTDPPPPPTLKAARILIDLLVGINNGLLVYSPFLLISLWGLWISLWQARRTEALVTGLFFVGLWVVASLHQSQFNALAEEASGLGPRQVFPAVPLLAAFSGIGLPRTPPRLFCALMAVSIGFGYLGAQAGMTPGTMPVVYVLKTCVSGTGMGILFKEALPVWYGFETLHTTVSRADVTAADLIRMLPTIDGLRLARNQATMLAVNLVVLTVISRFIWNLWRTKTPLVRPTGTNFPTEASERRC
jgi:hypothetical protein